MPTLRRLYAAMIIIAGADRCLTKHVSGSMMDLSWPLCPLHALFPIELPDRPRQTSRLL